MRTTVTIDDDVFRQAKEQAARNGQTFSEFVAAALRRRLQKQPSGFPVSNGGGLRPGVNLEGALALMDEEEWFAKEARSRHSDDPAG